MKQFMKKIIIGGLSVITAVASGMIISAGVYAAGLSDVGAPYSEGYSEDEEYSIVPLHAGSSSIDVASETGSRIQLYKSHRGNNQRWTIRKNGKYFYLKDSYTKKVLEVSGGSVFDGQSFTLSNYSGADKQLFELDPANDGTYYLRSKLNRGYVLDVYRIESGNGSNILLCKWNGGPNQRFRFVHLTTPEDMSDWGAKRHDCSGTNWDFWDGSYDNKWYYENVNASVYKLQTASQLAGLSQLVRDGVQSFNGRTILLENDIDLCGTEWRRIGNGSRPFKGSFNGQGHAIIGLSITTTDSEDGFFGCVEGSSITNFAIKGAVSGDWNTGGVIGKVVSGHIVNIYSEVSITRATDDNEGGICGRLGSGGYVEHCTQNARVNSGDKDPDRGGIVGYNCGVIRYCVNRSSVDCNWNYVGGICGECNGGKVEFCANYGQVSGGGDTERAGGICGMVLGDGKILGCYNSGTVFSSDDDYIGGICGKREGSGEVYACINVGRVYGDDQIGGILGDGSCYYSFNAGYITGDDDVGAVSGSASNLSWCRALSWSSKRLHGDGGDNGAEWVSAEDIIGGKVCYDLNRREQMPDFGNYYSNYSKLFYQNIGGDLYPTFSGSKVINSNGKYINESGFQVRASYDKEYGSVTGSGSYTSGKVVISAKPADGCIFDHFEVSTTKVGTRSMHSGNHNAPASETKTYNEATITLTDNITRSYDVKAVFKIYDNVPDDLRQMVKVELECVDESGGWNGDTIPVYLVDSSGNNHLWEISRSGLDDDYEKVNHTFDLGAESPVAIYAYPDFGGGFTFHDYGLKAKMWVNNAGTAIESNKVMINSYPFISSKYGNDYMHMAFEDCGNSSVGTYDSKGNLKISGTYTRCSDAWNAAKKLGSNGVIRLNGVWIISHAMELSGGKVTIDLNGYPLINSVKKASGDGEVFKIKDGGELDVVDSNPSRKTCSAFYGGSIQGGRSSDTGGLIQVNKNSTFKMTRGTLYNGGTTDKGGAIRCDEGKVILDNTLIANCWSGGAWFTDNDGGAISLHGGEVNLNNCTIRNCKAVDEGGAINQDGGTLICTKATIRNNRSEERGGAIYVDSNHRTKIYSSLFRQNNSDEDGGAIGVDDTEVEFYDITMTDNNAGEDGGALWINADKVFITGCDIRDNYSGEEGGGIYVDSMYDTNIQGKCIIKNNTDKGGKADVTLQDGVFSQARLYVGGLTEGSSVGLDKTSGLSSGGEKLVIGATSFETSSGYYFADRGNLDYRDVGEKKEIFMATATNSYSYAMYLILALELIGAAIVLVPIFIRRKK